MSEAERNETLERQLGELYDKLYVEIWQAGSAQSYIHSSGREDFVKECMTIVDKEIEQLKKKDKSPPAVAESREIVKYEKPALQK